MYTLELRVFKNESVLLVTLCGVKHVTSTRAAAPPTANVLHLPDEVVGQESNIGDCIGLIEE